MGSEVAKAAVEAASLAARGDGDGKDGGGGGGLGRGGGGGGGGGCNKSFQRRSVVIGELLCAPLVDWKWYWSRPRSRRLIDGDW
jgi:hypothetical protein